MVISSTSQNYDTGNIDYIYDATGIKLKKIVTVTNPITQITTVTTTSYAGNYIYKQDGVAETLEFFSQPEGYITPEYDGSQTTIQKFNYIYQYKDHLGNIRLSYNDEDGDKFIAASTEIVEENNYYPFGLKHKGYNNFVSSGGNATTQKFKYNGFYFHFLVSIFS